MTDGKELREFVARSRESSPSDQPDRGPACQYLENCTGPVAVVGGGYIGIEMAEALASNDFEVHLFQRGDRVLKGFSKATSEAVAEHLEEQSVAVYLDAEVESIEGSDAVEAVATADERVPVEMVLLGTGVRPRTELAEDAGIELGPTGAIATDEYRETNVPDVYAAGDCSEAEHVVTGEPAYVPLALTANRHGRAVGQTVAGTPTEAGGSPVRRRSKPSRSRRLGRGCSTTTRRERPASTPFRRRSTRSRAPGTIPRAGRSA